MSDPMFVLGRSAHIWQTLLSMLVKIQNTFLSRAGVYTIVTHPCKLVLCLTSLRRREVQSIYRRRIRAVASYMYTINPTDDDWHLPTKATLSGESDCLVPLPCMKLTRDQHTGSKSPNETPVDGAS